jgi:DNA polymerase-4
MDAFFAAVEILANPHLKGQPVVVGGTPGSRGVATTASYEARRFGIRPGMAISEAVRRCPGAVFLRGDGRKYTYYSTRMLELLGQFSPLVEPFSIDEAFVELTGRTRDLVEGREVAERIQAAIERNLGLSASIGVGPSRFLAKMASGVAKPHGITVLDAESFRRLFWQEPVESLFGVGEKTASQLQALGIRTIGGLARAPGPVLVRSLGRVGGHLHALAWGSEATPLIPFFGGGSEKSSRSMGHEQTLARDERDQARLEAVLLRLTEKVARRLRRAGMKARTVTVKLRFSDFRTITRQRTLPQPTDEERFLYPLARELMGRHRGGAALRLVGISASGLTGGPAPTYLLVEDRRHRQVLGAVDEVRDRYGERVITRARTLTVAAGRRMPANSKG